MSRKEHLTAQTRELQCVRQVLPQVLEKSNHTLFSSLCKLTLSVSHIVCVFTLDLKVVEVAHDHQVQVKKYVTEDLELINSYDTWHGKSKVFEHVYL